MTFNNKTIEDLHNLLVSKEISATELTQATLEDIKSRETAINAFVTIAEEQALAQAKAIDEAGIDADNVLSGIQKMPDTAPLHPEASWKAVSEFPLSPSFPPDSLP